MHNLKTQTTILKHIIIKLLEEKKRKKKNYKEARQKVSLCTVEQR